MKVVVLNKYIVRSIRKYLRPIGFIVIAVASLSGCGPNKNQQAKELEEVPIRVFHQLDHENEVFLIEDIKAFDQADLKFVYEKYADLYIEEDNLRKSVIISATGTTIVEFYPVVDGIEVNNSYVLQIRDQVLTTIATNPSKFIIPATFELEKVLSIHKQTELKKQVLDQMNKFGKVLISDESLYFDTHEYGVLVYTIKVDIETLEYGYAEVFIFDAYSGNQLN